MASNAGAQKPGAGELTGAAHPALANDKKTQPRAHKSHRHGKRTAEENVAAARQNFGVQHAPNEDSQGTNPPSAAGKAPKHPPVVWHEPVTKAADEGGCDTLNTSSQSKAAAKKSKHRQVIWDEEAARGSQHDPTPTNSTSTAAAKASKHPEVDGDRKAARKSQHDPAPSATTSTAAARPPKHPQVVWDEGAAQAAGGGGELPPEYSRVVALRGLRDSTSAHTNEQHMIAQQFFASSVQHQAQAKHFFESFQGAYAAGEYWHAHTTPCSPPSNHVVFLFLSGLWLLLFLFFKQYC